MQIDEITDRFEQIESDHTFSTERTRYAWERIRNTTYRRIVSEHTEIGASQEVPEVTTLEKVMMALRSMAVSFMVLLRGFDGDDALIYGHQRRKEIDGEYWDIYVDPVLEATGLEDYLYLESAWQYNHFTPRYTDNVVETDFIDIGAKVVRRFMGDQLDENERDELLALQDELESIGLSGYDMVGDVERILREDRAKRWWYRRILRQVQPEKVLLVVSYGKEGFIRACRSEDVPVWELQHGTMSRYHKGYDRRRFNKDAFPDHLLLYGEYWNDITQFPIDDEQVDVLGNPFFHRQKDELADVENDIDVLFLSQPSISDTLSSFALQVAQATDQDIIYKPHPGEERIEQKYAELRKAGITIETAADLYPLINRSEKVVGVYTTALYEALALGTPVYILETDGWRYVADLIQNEYATLVRSPDDFESSDLPDIDLKDIFSAPDYDVLSF